MRKCISRKIYAYSRFFIALKNSILIPLFAVSQKINLLNQLTRQNSNGSSNGSGMSNQKTLDIIREDLGHLVETEGTYWDSRHPHIFAVMGASVILYVCDNYKCFSNI